MTTATKTTKRNQTDIEIKLTRAVSDKVAHADGYNIKTGREVYENYEVKITSKVNGAKASTSGKPGGFAFLSIVTDKSKIAKGGYARLGDAYISKSLYDVCMTMIAELDTEVGKTDEQTELELAQAEAKKNIYIEPKHGDGWCTKCHSYCYGDCEA